MKQLLASQVAAGYLLFLFGKSYNNLELVSHLFIEMFFLGPQFLAALVVMVWLEGERSRAVIYSALPFVYGANIRAVLVEYQWAPWWVLLIPALLTITLLIFIRKKLYDNK